MAVVTIGAAMETVLAIGAAMETALVMTVETAIETWSPVNDG